jgi:hypothetical protein
MSNWMANVVFTKDPKLMAKTAPKKAVKPATKAAKTGRRTTAAKPTKAVKAKSPEKKPAAVKAPVVSKDELRAQLEKAQATITTLRTKSREATRAAKASAAQIAELEAKLGKLEKKAAAEAKPTGPILTTEKSTKPRGRKPSVNAEPEVPAEAAKAAPAESETSEE